MGNDSKAIQKIRCLCNLHHLKQDEVLAKAKLVLENYQQIAWADNQRMGNSTASLYEIRDKMPEEAILFLAGVAPTVSNLHFQEQILKLLEADWLTELICSAMKYVEAFPVYGSIYYNILSDCYLSDAQYPDRYCIKAMGLERSVYYQRKKEATLVFGVSLWGIMIPHWLKLYHINDNQQICSV